VRRRVVSVGSAYRFSRRFGKQKGLAHHVQTVSNKEHMRKLRFLDRSVRRKHSQRSENLKKEDLRAASANMTMRSAERRLLSKQRRRRFREIEDGAGA
jgi:hypothetical protein